MTDTTEMKALKWLFGRDTGQSSEAIAAHMLGLKSTGQHPWDADDLGRCVRLLELFPEWKARIFEMSAYGGAWVGLCKNWEQLTEMFLAKDRNVNSAMSAVIRGERDVA